MLRYLPLLLMLPVGLAASQTASQTASVGLRVAVVGGNDRVRESYRRHPQKYTPDFLPDASLLTVFNLEEYDRVLITKNRFRRSADDLWESPLDPGDLRSLDNEGDYILRPKRSITRKIENMSDAVHKATGVWLPPMMMLYVYHEAVFYYQPSSREWQRGCKTLERSDQFFSAHEVDPTTR